jgi:hypothetical protein
VATRVASRVAIGPELACREASQAGLFVQLAGDSGLERFILVDEPAWERPTTPVWLVTAFDEQHVEAAVAGGQADGVDGYRRTWLGVAVVWHRTSDIGGGMGHGTN